MPNIPKKIDAIFEVSYHDAAFSYEKNVDSLLRTPPPIVTTVARICHIDSVYTNLCVVWSDSLNLKGIVLPTACVISISPLYPESIAQSAEYTAMINILNTSAQKIAKQRNSFLKTRKGTHFSISWNDIRLYHNADNVLPTSMYIEGVYEGSNDLGVFLSDPENINMDKGVNHPEKKAHVFYLPWGMIVSKEIPDTVPMFNIEDEAAAISNKQTVLQSTVQKDTTYKIAAIKYNAKPALLSTAGYVTHEDSTFITIASTKNVQGYTEEDKILKADVVERTNIQGTPNYYGNIGLL